MEVLKQDRAGGGILQNAANRSISSMWGIASSRLGGGRLFLFETLNKSLDLPLYQFCRQVSKFTLVYWAT